MREQLIQYVDLLFAGTGGCEDIKQEILQNTLDRYDDLIAEGRSPEAAYRLAIMGIGDINEILGATNGTAFRAASAAPAAPKNQIHDTPAKKLMRAIAVGLYILCPVPVIALSGLPGDIGIYGVCGLLAMVAVGTVLMVLGSKNKDSGESWQEKNTSAQTELKKSIDSMIWVIGLALYFIISFSTGAWYVTWVVFPLTGAVQGLVRAILDLKEANNHEK